MTDRESEKKISPEELQLLVDAGREMGSTLLANAVRTAKSNEQMGNQIFVLEVAAQHILALCAYNQKMAKGIPTDETIDSFYRQMKTEVGFFNDVDMEKVTFPTCSESNG